MTNASLNIFFLSFLSIVFSSCAVSNSEPFRLQSMTAKGYKKKPIVPGKCFSKVLILDKYEIQPKSIAIFTGDNIDLIGVQQKEIVYKPEKTNWVFKRQLDCGPGYPWDCIVWEAVKIPPAVEKYYVVIDTTLVKSFEMKVIKQEKLVKKGGFSEWREVVCGRNRSPELYEQIQMSLLRAGFGRNLRSNGKFSAAWYSELIKYQKANDLPLGDLDYETLSFLDIE